MNEVCGTAQSTKIKHHQPLGKFMGKRGHERSWKGRVLFSSFKIRISWIFNWQTNDLGNNFRVIMR